MEVRTSTSQADGHVADAAVGVTLPEVVSRRSTNDERYKPTMRASRLRKRLLIVSDLATLVAACLAMGLAMTRVWDNSTREALVAALVLSALLLPLWAAFSLVYGLYRRETRRADLTATDDVVPALTILSLSSWAIVLAVTLSGSSIPVSLVVGLWAVSLFLVLAGRVATRSLARQWPQSVENTLIVGAGDIGQLLGRKLAQHPELGLRLVGFADDDPKAMRTDLTDVPVLGCARRARGRSCASTTSIGSSSPSRTSRTTASSSSCTSCAAWTSRSISYRDSSRPSARRRTFTTSKAFPRRAAHRAQDRPGARGKARDRHRWDPALAARRAQPAVLCTSPGASGGARAARSSSARSGSERT